MSRDDEEGGVSGVGLGLGVAAGTGAAYVGDQMLSADMVQKAWKGEEGVDKSVFKKVQGWFKNTKEGKKLVEQRDGINAFNSITDPEKKIKLKVESTAEAGATAASSTQSTALVQVEQAANTAQTTRDAAQKTLDDTTKSLKRARNAAKKTQLGKDAKAAEAELAKANQELNAAKDALLNHYKTAPAAAPVEAPEVASGKKAKVEKYKTETAHVENGSVSKTKGGGIEVEFTQNGTNKAGTELNGGKKFKIKTDAVDGVKKGSIKQDKLGHTFEELKTVVQSEEKALTRTAMKGSGMSELGQGMKFASNAGKAKVVVAALAATGVGLGIGSYMFPSHVRNVENRRAAQADMGRT